MENIWYVKIVENQDIIFISTMMEDMYVISVLDFILHVLHVESYMISMILNMGMPEEENVFPVEIRAMLINYIWALRNCIKKIAKHYTNRIEIKKHFLREMLFLWANPIMPHNIMAFFQNILLISGLERVVVVDDIGNPLVVALVGYHANMIGK